MTSHRRGWALLVALWIGLLPAAARAVYDVPNDDADCPADCRQIPWLAGSDQWNNGSLPLYPSVTCAGLTEGNSTTDNGPAIQAYINSAATGTAVAIPAGVYYVNSVISLESNVVLRGARSSQAPFLPIGDAAATTLKLGDHG